MIYEYDENAKRRYVLSIECSSSKGIKMIKDQVIFFAKQQMNKSKYDFKSIVLYDAEFLTHDAQYSLRRCIEEYSGNTRFFMVCHDKNKLLNPICSRFSQIYIGEYQKKYIFGDKFDERKFMQNQITLKKKMDGCLDCGISELAKLVETLYMHGIVQNKYFSIFVKIKNITL